MYWRANVDKSCECLLPIIESRLNGSDMAKRASQMPPNRDVALKWKLEKICWSQLQKKETLEVFVLLANIAVFVSIFTSHYF